MHESHAAVQAFTDYAAMPAGQRSLARLAGRYRTCTEAIRTRQVSTLKPWLSAFAWEARIAAMAAAEREAAEARLRVEREAVLTSGLALDYRRVEQLKQLAEKECKLVNAMLDELEQDAHAENSGLTRRIQVLDRALARTLAALAAETGGRAKQQINVVRELSDYALMLGRQNGYDEQLALSIARMIAEDATGG